MTIIEIIILALFLFGLLSCALYESIQARKLYKRRIKALENIAYELKLIRVVHFKIEN